MKAESLELVIGIVKMVEQIPQEEVMEEERHYTTIWIKRCRVVIDAYNALLQKIECQQEMFDSTIRRLTRENDKAWKRESEALMRAEYAEKGASDWEGTARQQAGTIEILQEKLRAPGEAWSENPRTSTRGE